MRWSVFFIFAYVFLAIETGLDVLLEFGQVAPSFMLVLAVFIGLSAPRTSVIWSMLALGLLTDVTRDYSTVDQQVLRLIGPATLGYLAGAVVVLQLRPMVYRDSVIALVVMVFVVGIFVYLVTVAMLTIRSLPFLPWSIGDPIAGWSAASELVTRFSELVYCAIVAVPLGILLLRTEKLWAFQLAKGSRNRRPFKL
jgi:hypothetical protein